MTPRRRPLPVIQARPLSPLQSALMKQAGRGSGVIDPTRTGTDPALVEQLRGEFSGPARSGYNFLSVLGGKHLAAYVPGTQTPIGFHRSPVQAGMNALALLPPARGAFGLTDVAARAALRGYTPSEGFLPSFLRRTDSGLKRMPSNNPVTAALVQADRVLVRNVPRAPRRRRTP